MKTQGKEVLAFEHFGAEIGRDLYDHDLKTDEQVESLFDLCGILQATITDIGWQYLFRKFGFQGLLKIDKTSEWMWSVGKETGEWMEDIVYYSLIGGYNPINKCLGQWDEKTNIFCSGNTKTEIDWKLIRNLDIKNL